MSRIDGDPTAGFTLDLGELHGLIRRVHNIRTDFLSQGCFAEPARFGADTTLDPQSLGDLPGARELTSGHRRAAARMVDLLTEFGSELDATATELRRAADRYADTEADLGAALRTEYRP